MVPILMPQIGQDIEAGTIVQWRKRQNDPVEKGEVILVVESEKAAFDVEAEASGVLLKILHDEGEQVAILQPVGYIGQPGERFEPQAAAAPGEPAETRRQEPQPAVAGPHPKGERLLASPAARRIAQEHGLDLASLRGSGPGGRITQDDVLAAVATVGTAAGGQDTIVPFGKIRRRVAERLTASKRTIPHFYLFADVDMTAAQAWRRRFNAEHSAHLTVTDLVIKAAAVALRGFPRLNAHVEAQRLIVKKGIHVGVAVAVAEGLLVPVIADADKKPLPEISRLAKDSAEAARRGVIRALSRRPRRRSEGRVMPRPSSFHRETPGPSRHRSPKRRSPIPDRL